MKLETAREAYEALSGKTSDIARQLCFAAIALIWLFKAGTASSPLIPANLLGAALFVFLALFFDLTHYLLGTIIWFTYFRRKERAGTSADQDFLAPASLNWPTWILFFLKVACTVVSYLWFIIPFLVQKFVNP